MCPGQGWLALGRGEPVDRHEAARRGTTPDDQEPRCSADRSHQRVTRSTPRIAGSGMAAPTLTGSLSSAELVSVCGQCRFLLTWLRDDRPCTMIWPVPSFSRCQGGPGEVANCTVCLCCCVCLCPLTPLRPGACRD